MKAITKPFLWSLTALLFFLVSGLQLKAADLRPGDKAPEFSLPDANGISQSLSALRGNLVLLYFWNSHEPNTEVLAPNLNILNEKYRQVRFGGTKSFKIFAVSLDEDKSTWLTQVNKYRIAGTHVLDIYGQTPSLYGFRQVPTWFLLDEAGTVIGVNMSLAELDRALAERAVTWLPDVAQSSSPATMTYSNTSSVRSIPASDMMLMSDVQTQKERNGAIVVQQQQPNMPPAATTVETGVKPSVFGVETAPAASATAANTITPQKTYTKGPHYKVQLGAYRFLNSADFDKARTLGEVFSEPSADNSGLQRIVLGDFKEKQEAVAALAKLQEMGYPDAFVLLYDTEKRIRPLAKDEVSKIAKSKGIVLAVPAAATASTTTTNTAAAPLVKVADKMGAKEKISTPATFNAQEPLSVHTPQTHSSDKAKVQDNYFPTIADTKTSGKTNSALPLVGSTAATTIYTPSGTYSSDNNQTYTYTPSSNTNNVSRVETYSTGMSSATMSGATGNIGVGTTIPTYVSMPKATANVYTPSGSYQSTSIATHSVPTTSKDVNALPYGQMSESYSRNSDSRTGTYGQWQPVGGGSSSNSGQWQPVSGGSSSSSGQWQPVGGNTTTSPNNGGVWVPGQIPVFSEPTRPATTSTSGSGTYYDNSSFDWYPTNNSNKTAAPTTTNKPATFNNNATSATTSVPATKPVVPAANTSPATTASPAAGNPAAAKETDVDKNSYLNNYVDSYMKSFEPKSSKKLKAKDKREKKEAKKKEKEKNKNKNKNKNKKQSWLD